MENSIKMAATLGAEYWWLLLLRGLFLLLFGIFVLAWPGMTTLVFLYAVGLYLLVAGVFDIIRAITQHSTQRYWFLVIILSVIEIGVAIYLLQHPGVALSLLVLLLGFVFIVRGVFEMINAFGVSKSGGEKVLEVVIGVLAILAGIILVRYPLSGGLAFLWILGIYALIAGPILIALSIGVKTDSDNVLREA